MILLLIGFILGIAFIFIMAMKEMIDEADKCEECHEDLVPFDYKKNYKHTHKK